MPVWRSEPRPRRRQHLGRSSGFPPSSWHQRPAVEDAVFSDIGIGSVIAGQMREAAEIEPHWRILRCRREKPCRSQPSIRPAYPRNASQAARPQPCRRRSGHDSTILSRGCGVRQSALLLKPARAETHPAPLSPNHIGCIARHDHQCRGNSAPPRSPCRSARHPSSASQRRRKTAPSGWSSA